MKHLSSNTYDLLGKNRIHQQNNNYNSNNKVQFYNKINQIDFFLFDNCENIKSKKELDYKYNNYNFFFLFIKQNGKSVQKIYNLNDFIQDYCFIKIENNPKNQIGILYPKNKMVDNINFIKNQILRDINNSIYKQDIYKDLKILNSNNLELYVINNQRNTSDNFFNIIFNIRENSSNNEKNKFRNYNKINFSESHINDDSNLINQLNAQIKILKEENSKLTQEINITKTEKLILKKELNSIKNKSTEYIKQINDLKEKIQYLSDKNNELETKIKNMNNNISNKYNNSILDLINHIEIFKNKLGFDLDKDDNLMIVEFTSVNQQITHQYFICKNTLQFTALENMLYNKNPQLREGSSSHYFLVKGISVNRYKTLEENGIKNMDVITLSSID